MKNQSILNEANQIINGERQDTYGAPENSFTTIAGFWNVYLDNREPGPLTAIDTAHMMTLFKMARCLGQKPHRDNYVDAAGYLAIAADRLLPKEEEAGPVPAPEVTEYPDFYHKGEPRMFLPDEKENNPNENQEDKTVIHISGPTGECEKCGKAWQMNAKHLFINIGCDENYVSNGRFITCEDLKKPPTKRTVAHVLNDISITCCKCGVTNPTDGHVFYNEEENWITFGDQITCEDSERESN